MKENINDAYYRKPNSYKKNTSTDKKKYTIFATAKRKSQDDPSNPDAPKKDYVTITLENIVEDDANQIKDTLIPSAKVGKEQRKYKNGFYYKQVISFVIPYAKFSKWVKLMAPKIETILDASSETYTNASDLATIIIEAVHDAPSEETTERARQSLKELEEAVYKAISENRWDDAMVLYKKAINLVARVYGVQLSPNNVKSIYAQAEKAGIKPSDKGAATDSYWEDGTEKFWPTFVRSARAWRKDFNRTIKDEPKMQYAIYSGNRKTASSDVINNRLKSQGFQSMSDLSAQQADRIKSGGISGGFQGVGYDISDTEGPDDFFNAPGLLNNLDGTLTDSAVADNDMWMKKLQDLKKNNPNANIDDDSKRRELVSTEEGRAQIYLTAIEELCKKPRYEGGWEDLNVAVNNSDDKILAYLLTIEDVAKKKISQSGWKNNVNITKIAQMVTASIALCTVGKTKVQQLGYDFRDVSKVFSSFEECKSTVLSVSDSILSALHRATNYEDKKNADSLVNENRLHKFFNLLERMENMYNENYNYELSEGIINRPSDNAIMNFLGELGLSFENDSELI